MEQPITSTNKAGDRIKDEFTGFYIGKILFDTDVAFTVYNLIIYHIYKGVDRLNHLW